VKYIDVRVQKYTFTMLDQMRTKNKIMYNLQFYIQKENCGLERSGPSKQQIHSDVQITNVLIDILGNLLQL